MKFFLVVLAFLISGLNSQYSYAQTSPMSFQECVTGAKDCCSRVCRPFITACCNDNYCGLPNASKLPVDIVKGKGPFYGLSLYCSQIGSTLAPYTEE